MFEIESAIVIKPYISILVRGVERGLFSSLWESPGLEGLNPHPAGSRDRPLPFSSTPHYRETAG